MIDKGCSRCALHRTTGNVCVGGSGPANARIMVVSEAPGPNEESGGLPFMGDSGRQLNEMLVKAGLRRSDIYFTSAVKCRPPSGRQPRVAEADACLLYLTQELDEIQPEVVVCLGNTALQAVTGKRKVSEERGKIHLPRRGLRCSATITATYHPSVVLYEPGKVETIVDDLRLVKALLRPDMSESDHVRYRFPRYDDSGLSAAAALNSLSVSPYISVDLEWTAGLATKGRKKGAMIWPWTGGGEVYSVAATGQPAGSPPRTVELSYPLPHVAREALERLLLTVPVVAHNATADLLWLTQEGFTVAHLADTNVLAHLHDETKRSALGESAPRYAEEVKPGWKGGIRYSRPSTEEEWLALLDYNGNDTFATFHLYAGLKRAIYESGRGEEVMRLHRALTVPALRLLLRAALVGVPFNETKVLDAKVKSESRLLRAAEDLAAITGTTPPIAIKMANSPTQVGGFLRDALKINLESTNKDELSNYLQVPAVAALLRVRKESKLLSTYLGPWATMLARQGDGRIHTIYRVTGTRTGRLSSEAELGGPLQVTPRGSPEVPIRDMVEAEAGRKIVSADYSTVEMRIAAWRADEKVMLKVFEQPPDSPGGDIHRSTAGFLKALADMPDLSAREYVEKWASVYVPGVTKVERQGAKGVNFGLTYGMKEERLVTYARTTYQTTLTLDQAKNARRSYMELYSGILPWHMREMRNAARLHYTETVFGRRRHGYYDDDDLLSSINTPIQSTASDLALLSMVQADRRFKDEGLDAVIIGFVHDSILVDAAEGDAERVRFVLMWSMEHVDTSEFGFEVPIQLPTEGKIGQTWAE